MSAHFRHAVGKRKHSRETPEIFQRWGAAQTPPGWNLLSLQISSVTTQHTVVPCGALGLFSACRRWQVTTRIPQGT